MAADVVARWHALITSRSEEALASLVADDVVFHSPVVHSPQVGKAVVLSYLQAALQVFGDKSFRYVRQLVGEHDAVLEFEVELGGIYVNGVDMLRWDDDGRIIDFKVMLRPLKAINLIHQKMAERLAHRR
jgi:hypothetical protein